MTGRHSLMPRLIRTLTLFLLSVSLPAMAADIDNDGIESSVDANDAIPLYHVSAGARHTCALDDSGVRCWGFNFSNRANPPELNGRALQVSAGGSHTCAISGSEVTCWGLNNDLQASPPELDNPVMISAGGSHTCAIENSGVVCWGNQDDDKTHPPTLNRPRAISAGTNHTCALDETGVLCWGGTDSGVLSPLPISDPVLEIQSGNAYACARTSTDIICWGDIPAPSNPKPEFISPKGLAVGKAHACAIEDGKPICWGDNSYGQSSAPDRNDIVQITAGDTHTCALTSSEVICWGDRSDGATLPPDLIEPTEVAARNGMACAIDGGEVKCWGDMRSAGDIPTFTDATNITLSSTNGCAIENGTVICWGNDSNGVTSPPSLNSPVALSMKGNAACAIDSNGTTCWGDSSPDLPTSSANATVIALGPAHTCLADGDRPVCWGNNGSGETTPTISSGVTDLALGFSHSCAIADNSVKCWGDNRNYQLLVPRLTTPTKIAAAQTHTCAIHSGGMRCWGLDTYNNYPTTLQNVVDVAVSAFTNCAISDSGLQCWGRNAYSETNSRTALSFSDHDGDGELDDTDPSAYNPTIYTKAPIADAGGAYEFVEGLSGQLDARASRDEGGVLTTWEWDIDSSDGVNFLNPDVSGETPEVSFETPGIYTITLRVTDGEGLTDTAQATATVLADTDRDSVPDINDTYPDSASASTDSDGDGFPDDCTSNQECLEDGLTPDPSLDDFDNDGIPTAEDSNDNLDTAPPSVIAAGDISLVASGEITLVDLLQESTPYASDFPNTVLAVLPKTEENNTTVEFESGRHQIEWCASDAAGNEGCDTQIVEITPLVSFTTVSQIAAEGGMVDVEVRLSGNPIQYPVKIPLRVNETLSTADNPGDHDASSQMISILEDDPLDDLQANMGRMQITITDDGVTGEADESITLELVTELDADSPEDKLIGAALGPQPDRTHIVTITEENVPPTVEIISDGQISLSDSSAKATVEIDDPNNHPSYFISWYLDGELIASGTDLLQVIYELGEISEGEHTLRVTVLDTGSPPRQGEDETIISYKKPSQSGGSSSSSSSGGGSGGSITLMLLVSLAVFKLHGRQRLRTKP